MFSSDLECFGLIDKYGSADESERRRLSKRFQRLRRQPALNDLGAQGDASTSPTSTLFLTTILVPESFWSTDRPAPPISDDVKDSTTEDECETDADVQEKGLWEKRALWESTLPTTFEDSPGQITPGYTYDYIDMEKTPRETYERVGRRSNGRPNKFNVRMLQFALSKRFC